MKTFTKIICMVALSVTTAVAQNSTGSSSAQNDDSSVSGTVVSENNGNSAAFFGTGNGSGNGTFSLTDPVITGPLLAVCPGQTRTYSSSSVPNATTYTWVAPPNCTVVSGQGTATCNIHFGAGFFQGYVRVTASNAVEHSHQVVVTVFSAPTAPLPIQGPALGACGGGTYTYSIPPVASAQSYTWTAPANAMIVTPAASGNPLTTSVTSVDITFPAGFHDGIISVRANSGCNSSIKRSMNVRSVPVAPAPIDGLQNGLCDLPNVAYSVPAVPGATSYTWSISPPAGTTIHNNGSNSITVDFDLTFRTAWIQVTADNVCGHGDPRRKELNAWPGKPIVPVGPVGACNNDPNNSIAYYQVDPVFGANYYHWFVPTGATITAGQGTTNVTVDYLGSSSGDMRVRAENSCGFGPTSIKAITVNSCRLANGETSVMELAAYPNPAKDNLTVSFSAQSNETYTIEMFDMTGRLVISQSNMSTIGVNKQEINLQNISTGLYNLVVKRGTVTERLRVVVE
jgi:hypothetical protein